MAGSARALAARPAPRSSVAAVALSARRRRSSAACDTWSTRGSRSGPALAATRRQRNNGETKSGKRFSPQIQIGLCGTGCPQLRRLLNQARRRRGRGQSNCCRQKPAACRPWTVPLPNIGCERWAQNAATSPVFSRGRQRRCPTRSATTARRLARTRSRSRPGSSAASAGDLMSAARRSAGDDHHALSEESRVTRRYDTAELPPGLSPRLLSREQAAAYGGVSPTHFSETIGTEVRDPIGKPGTRPPRW